jgi:hypothetical protein
MQRAGQHLRRNTVQYSCLQLKVRDGKVFLLLSAGCSLWIRETACAAQPRCSGSLTSEQFQWAARVIMKEMHLSNIDHTISIADCI